MSNSSTPKAQPKEKQRKTYGKCTRQKMNHPSGSVYWRVSGTKGVSGVRRHRQSCHLRSREAQGRRTEPQPHHPHSAMPDLGPDEEAEASSW